MEGPTRRLTARFWYTARSFPQEDTLPETPKQKMRRLLDRLTIDAAKKREIDGFIEEMEDEYAEHVIEMLEDMERKSPGTIDEFILDINTNGIPDEDDGA